MKPSLLSTALVAVASSLVAVLTIELLRDGRATEPSVAEPSAESVAPSGTTGGPRLEAARDASGSAQPPPSASSAGRDDERLAALERRIEALELGLARRSSEPPPAVRPEDADELRELVLSWVAEDREARDDEEQRRQQLDNLTAMEFDARYRAMNAKREHDLTDWEEARLVEIFLEVERRSRALDASFDLAKDDPKEVEAKWEEFDAWAEQYEREMMGPELYERLSEDP